MKLLRWKLWTALALILGFIEASIIYNSWYEQTHHGYDEGYFMFAIAWLIFSGCLLLFFAILNWVIPVKKDDDGRK